MIEFQITEKGNKKRIVFSGDLGNCPNPLLPNTDQLSHVDYLLIESAYGNRNHEASNTRIEQLKESIMDTIKRKGVLLIPSFAIERTQEILYYINNMVEHREIPKVPIFIDSPLATKITKVYKGYESYFNITTRKIIRSGDDIFNFPQLEFTESKSESKRINNVKSPKIIIAGSGMSTGGRILHHEKRYLQNPSNIFLVVGFQVNGTLGRKILQGDPYVRIMDEMIHNKIEVRAIGGFSAHADQRQLLKVIKNITPAPKKIFIVQGELEAAQGLQKAINSKLKLSQAYIPTQGDVETL
jgi:metallo-beta-lactamase family protein